MNVRRVLGLVFVLTLAITAVACGDDDTTAETENTAGQGGSAEVSAELADVAEKIAEYSTRPSEIPVREPIDAEVPTGKRIVGFVCPLPACQELANAATEATKALGWEYVKIPSGFSPDEVTTAWQQGLREKPDGILTLSTDRAFYESQLAEAAKQDIPVLNMLVDKEAGEGISAVIYGPDFMRRIGTDMARWVAVDSNGTANTVMIYPAQIGILAQQAEAFTEEYEKVCADCELHKLEVPASSIGGDLTDRITGYLRANPDVDYAWVGYGDMLRGLPAAMNAAGIKDVKVFSNGGSLAADAAEYLRGSEHVEMFYAYAGTEVMWRGIDWFARTFAGVDTEPSTDVLDEAAWIVTPDTAPEGGAPFLVEDYAEQYKKLWGVS